VSRIVSWFSRGTASAVATAMILREHPEAIVVHSATNSEDEDNDRFEADCIRWWNHPVETIQSDEYADTWDVWERRRYINGHKGAPCTGLLKVEPRLLFQRPDDIHVFGYTADKRDVERAARLRETFFELDIRTPLIDAGLDKAACMAIVLGAGIELPRCYGWGLHNANCIPCGKGEAPGYWAVIRKFAPEKFWRFAKLSRSIGARCLVIKKVRYFVDELPDDWPLTNAIAPACDMLCGMHAEELTS